MIRSHKSVANNRNTARKYYGITVEHDGDTFVFHSMAPRSHSDRGTEDIWLTNGKRFIGATLGIHTENPYVIRVYGPSNDMVGLDIDRSYTRPGLRSCDDVINERQLFIP